MQVVIWKIGAQSNYQASENMRLAVKKKAPMGALFSKKLAPQVGLEPTTLRLTAECSAIELLRNERTRLRIMR